MAPERFIEIARKKAADGTLNVFLLALRNDGQASKVEEILADPIVSKIINSEKKISVEAEVVKKKKESSSEETFNVWDKMMKRRRVRR